MSKDTIYRQDAIDAMDECYWNIMGDKPPKLDEKTALYVDLKQAVKRLPAAETSIMTVKFDIDKEQFEKAWKQALANSPLTVLSAENTGKWIPCGERLPDECGDYLVTKETTGWNTLPYRAVDIAYFDSGCVWHKSSKVLAWMPLPEYYTGD